MPARTEYQILVTDQDLQVVGDPILCWTNLDVTLRFNEPGSGLFMCPGYAWIREQLAPGRRVVIVRNRASHGEVSGSVLIAGPIEKWLHERADDGENAGDGKLTVNFADDLASVVARQAYPDPTLAPAAQVIDAWEFTGNAEVGLRTLVNLNAGPGALTDRRVPLLVLGGLASVGTSITTKAELMEPLGTLMRRMADGGGGIGFRTVQQGTQILFEVYEPPDASDTVRFSFDMGNVKYMAYEVVAPTATVVIVGGQGEASDRALIERINSAGQAAWGRMETHLARPGSTPVAELEADGDAELVEKAETARVPTSAVDTEAQRFGVEYQLGSRVVMSPVHGQDIVDVVRTVHLQAWPTAGEVITPFVGSQAARTDPLWIQYMREVDHRVGRLERSVRSAAL